MLSHARAQTTGTPGAPAYWISALALATLLTGLRMDIAAWPVPLAWVMVGAIPFGLLGIAIRAVVGVRRALLAKATAELVTPAHRKGRGR